MTEFAVQEVVVPSPPPKVHDVRLTPAQWVRANLFSSPFNTVLTVAFSVGLAWAALRGVRFVFVNGEWEIVRRNIANFLVGRFPRDELWRVWVAIYLVAAVVGFAGGAAARVAAERLRSEGHEPEPVTWRGAIARFWPLALVVIVLLYLAHGVAPIGVFAGVIVVIVGARFAGRYAPRVVVRFSWLIVLAGFLGALQVVVGSGGVGWDRWGGLLLTTFATVAGIGFAFPIGLLLALGRRSSLPAVRAFSIGYIEFFRGVPLITLIFMGVFVIGFLFPPRFNVPSRLTRAMIAIVIFQAAYVAEVVRGGLHAIPRGQYEAAQALGLPPWKVMRRIVLPQALRAVIPAMVGQFISLYKDTSLLAVAGFLELLNVAQTVTQQPDFLGLGLHAETLAFAAFIYWAGSYTMSRESRRIERRLGVGER